MYTLRGGDKIYVRAKGGPNKSTIQLSPKFAKVRLNNKEWPGCTLLGSNIRSAFQPLNRLEDYAVSGALNALAKQIQLGDQEGEHGARGLFLSQHKEMLAGFNVSRKQVLETVLRVPMEYVVDRLTVSAKVTIQPINTDLHLVNFRNLPFFRIIITLGTVSDMTFVEANNQYQPTSPLFSRKGEMVESDWFSTHTVLPAQEFELRFPEDMRQLSDDVSLVLGIGVEFGNSGFDANPVGVKYTGCGKVVVVK
jgi:hypothetical protein